MTTSTLRRVQAILGIVLFFFGAVWFLQGIRVLPGSVMTGSKFWVVVGAFVAIVGIGVLAASAGRQVPRT